jgi:hypothetical protein
MGVAYLEMNRTEKYRIAPSPVWETIQLSKSDVSNKKFKEYALQVLGNILK